MFGIGFGEIIIIAMLALVLFGQDDLPANIRKAANGLKEFRKVTSNAQRAWHEVRSDMARTLLEESETEVGKKNTASVTNAGGAIAPNSSLVLQDIELRKTEDDDHYDNHGHHHPHGDDDHAALVQQEAHELGTDSKILGATAANIVIKAPEGIIAHGTHLVDADEVIDDAALKTPPTPSRDPKQPINV